MRVAATAAYRRFMELTFHTDPAAFLADAQEYLAVDPVITTVVSSLAHRAAGGASVEGPAGSVASWWLVVREGREGDGDRAGDPGRTAVVGAGMRTMGFPTYLLPMPEAAARALGSALLARDEPVDAANGAVGACRALLEKVASVRGGEVTLSRPTRLYRLGILKYPVGVLGKGRLAVLSDVELLAAWRVAFGEEVDDVVAAPRGEDDAARLAEALAAVEEGIAQRTLWVWEAPDGEVVSMVGARLPAYGVSRVGPVYTPPTHRGRGYAGAATALASAGLRELGASEVCLFTDLDNPISNGVYRRIGYVPVLDAGNFRLVVQ